MTETLWLVSGVVVALLAAIVLAVASAMLERSGPIRLRHWVEEAGGRLRTLFERRGRFEAFRFLLSLLTRLAAVGLYAAIVLLLVDGEVGVSWIPHLWAFAVVVVTLAGTELTIRHLVAVVPEETLKSLTWLYAVLLVFLRPLLSLLAPVLPRVPESEMEQEDEIATREEIEAFIDVGRREGILEEGEGELLRGLVDFGDTLVHSVMTPRVDMICAAVDTPPEELVELVLESGHSRIPLYRDSVDQIVGVLHVRDLLRALREDDETDLRSLLQVPHIVPETKTLGPLLAELQERHQELAVVVDEYGGVEGLVTIEDLLEEIFGEIVDEHDVEEMVEEELPDGSWRVDGRTSLEEVAELLGAEVPSNEPFETVGGLIFGVLGHVPKVGESVEAHELRFLVEEADHRRVRRARVSRQRSRSETEGPSVTEVPGGGSTS